MALSAPLAVERHREAVRLVADLLDEVQHGRVALQNDGLIFLAQHVKNFLFFRDAGYGLIDDLQRFECLGSGMKLADSTIDQDQPGKLFFFFLQAAIAAGDGFTHAGKIVVLTQGISVASLLAAPFLSTNNELAIVR